MQSAKKKRKIAVAKRDVTAWIPYSGGEFERTADKDLYYKWMKHRKNVELNMTLNQVVGESRAIYLLSVSGPYIQDLDTHLPQCDEIEKATMDSYEQLVTRITKFFKPKTNTALESNKFRDMEQKKNERMAEFVLRLREQADRCLFENLDNEIKMQIINKCFSKKLKSKFLEKEYTFEELINLAEVYEMKETYLDDEEEMKAGGSDKLFVLKDPKLSNKSFTCYSCGFEGHKSGERNCPAKNKECLSCHKIGHFARVCKSRSGTGQSNKIPGEARDLKETKYRHVNETKTEHDESSKYLFAMMGGSSDVTVGMDNIPVDVLIDSGADVNCITVDTWNKLKARKIKVHGEVIGTENEIKLFAYGSSDPLKIKGSFKCDISCGDRKVQGRVYVTECGTTNILGRGTSVELGILRLGMSIFHLTEEMPKIKGKQ